MRHLTTRLVVLLMLALMIITGAYDYVRLERERDRLAELARTDQRVFTETLALAVSRNVRRGRTTEELQELLEEIRARPGLVWAAVYDPDGHVVAVSMASGEPPTAADQLVHTALRAKATVVEPIHEAGGTVFRYIRPFRWSNGRPAALEVRESLERVEKEFARAVRESVVSRVVVLVFFVLSTVALTRWSIARPIGTLIRGARAVGAGDLTQRIDIGRRDELGELAEEFNRMAANLQQAHQALVEQSEQRLRLEREVQQAQKLVAVGMLAAQVAHEIGTPLNVISGRAEAVARSLPADHKDRRQLEAIQRQTDRIAGIVRELLDYARPRQPQLRDESLPAVLGRVTDLVDGRCREKSVRLRLELPPDLPPVVGDGDQLQQVFVNLIVNALDASPAGSAIRVTEARQALLPEEGRASVLRGTAERPAIAVHVLDEGPGMTKEELDQVFQPFFSTKKRGQGTGLGLPIVEEIVRAHHGEVEMLSVLGHGTEVIVRLPAATPPPDRDATTATDAPADSGSQPL
jgi:signal transduction histidine kinase